MGLVTADDAVLISLELELESTTHGIFDVLFCHVCCGTFDERPGLVMTQSRP